MTVHRRLPRVSLAAALSGVLLLSACGISGGSPSDDDAGPELTGEVSGEITFRTLQLKPDFTEFVEGVIDEFEAEYPDVTVVWEDVPGDGYNEKLVADGQAGELPDVLNLNTDSFQLLGDRGLLADITELSPEVEGDFVPGAWEQYQLPGRDGVYAYPWYVTPEILTYNAALYEQAGLDPDSPPVTVEEFLDHSEQIAEADGGFRAFMADPQGRLPGDWQKMGVPILNEDGTEFTFDTPKAVEWVTRMRDLYAMGAMPPESLTNADDINQLFGAGRLVFGPGSPGFIGDIRENASDIYEDTAVAGAVTGELGTIGIYTQSLGVNRNTDHPDAAAEFAKWITNGPNQVEFSQHATIYPSNADGLDDPFFSDEGDSEDPETMARVIGAEQLREADLKANTPVQWTNQVGDAVSREMQRAIQGDTEPADAVANAEQAANDILSQQQD